MTLESISTETVIEKLRDLRKSIPNKIDNFYVFGECIAQRLEGYEKLSPPLVCTAVMEGFSDITQGVYECGDPIPNRESQLSFTELSYIKMSVPEIIDEVCPKDFATKVIGIEQSGVPPLFYTG